MSRTVQTKNVNEIIQLEEAQVFSIFDPVDQQSSSTVERDCISQNAYHRLEAI